ncbi:MAG: hypothetical protein AAGC63_11205 [Propionicimonas sp.]|nr:hypothetical protein [Propionicimonas sp.]
MRVWLVSLLVVLAGCSAGTAAAPSAGDDPLGGQPAPRMTCHQFDDLSTPLAFHRSVAGYVECARRMWQAPLQKVGVEAPAPEVFTVGVEEGGACIANLPDNAAGLFCSDDGSLVFAADLIELAGYSGLTTPQVVFHEYAHAVQHAVGIDLDDDTELARRRVELQATCWSAMMLQNLNGLEVDDETRQALAAEVGSATSGEHGTGESRSKWALVGLDATTIGQCDTAAVAADEVA